MKFIDLTICLLLTGYSFTLRPDIKYAKVHSEYKPVQDASREKAFDILRNKCNTCHVTKKRAEIFTKLNMDSLAPAIFEQVFIKKKMPKGRKVKLTEKETQILKIWINTISGATRPSEKSR